jgi:hypothetical protein
MTSSTTTAQACASLYGIHSVVCDDLTSVIIQAILNLKGEAGSDAAAILAEIPNVCAGVTATLDEVETALSKGARKGTFRRIIPTVGATPTFMVNAYANLFNPAINNVYARYPIQCNSFFQCGAGAI